MKKQRYIVEIEMPDGDFIPAEWLKDLIQTDCDVEDEGGEKITVRVQETSLPSNLDEAAIPESEMVEWMKYGPHTNYPWCGIPDAIKITAEHFFALGKQAGAEWMAGQGVNADFEVCKLANRAWLTPIDEKRFIQDVFDNFAAGDKVVVQIRKK